jgi:hypothetical protein
MSEDSRKKHMYCITAILYYYHATHVLPSHTYCYTFRNRNCVSILYFQKLKKYFPHLLS